MGSKKDHQVDARLQLICWTNPIYRVSFARRPSLE